MSVERTTRRYIPESSYKIFVGKVKGRVHMSDLILGEGKVVPVLN
jgi:hypothetical protein